MVAPVSGSVIPTAGAPTVELFWTSRSCVASAGSLSDDEAEDTRVVASVGLTDGLEPSGAAFVPFRDDSLACDFAPTNSGSAECTFVVFAAADFGPAAFAAADLFAAEFVGAAFAAAGFVVVGDMPAGFSVVVLVPGDLGCARPLFAALPDVDFLLAA